MHWDGTISFGNVLTICTTLIGLMAGGWKIALHLQRSSDAMNNLAAITERLQHSVQEQDGRLRSLETEQEIQREVSKRVSAQTPVVQVNR
jgi:hypothetical protein